MIIAVFRLRMKVARRNVQRTLLGLRRMRIAAGILFVDSLLETSVIDVSRMEALEFAWVAVEIGLCVGFGFLLFLTRREIQQLAIPIILRSPRRGFAILMREESAAAQSVEDSASNDDISPAWLGLVTLVAVAMAIAHVGYAGNFLIGLDQRANSLNYWLWTMPGGPAVLPSGMIWSNGISQNISLALGVCGFFGSVG
ncbi:MAG TPA: hypothetical protein VFC78_20930 [Tepidisphaeraceae bacterium]|nr:hypothetical protein [Tepidisphaeraceae bacterium]